MKKIILLLLLLAGAGLVAFACLSEPEPTFPRPTEAVELPQISEGRKNIEDKGREALWAYIAAWLSMEKLAIDERNKAAGLTPLLEETKERWQQTLGKAKDLERTSGTEAGQLLPGESKVSLSRSLLGRASASMPLDRKREEALTEERKRIIDSYANYPYGPKLRLLAGQIGHDAVLALELLAQIGEGKSACQEAVARLTENCQISITASRLGGKLKFARPESHEAFAWFWGGTETFVTIEPDGTRLLLGKVPELIYITGDTEIIPGNKELTEADEEYLLKNYAGTASK